MCMEAGRSLRDGAQRGQLPPPMEFSVHTCKMAHFVTKLANAATSPPTAPPWVLPQATALDGRWPNIKTTLGQRHVFAGQFVPPKCSQT